ncbi:MAG: TldD/PmbA family protein [Promethearchaeota archaeon]
MEDGKDVADFAIDFGISQGASYVEARFIDSWEESFTLRNGKFIGIVENSDKGIGIRVLANGGMGFGSTEQLSKNSIQSLIKTIIRMTKAGKRKNPIVFSEEKIEVDNWKTETKENFKDISKEEKQKYIQNLDKELKTRTKKKLKDRFSLMELTIQNKYIITSEGAKIDSQKSLISVMLLNTAKGKLGTEQRVFSLGGSAGWEWLKDTNFNELVIQDGVSLVKTAENARNIKFNKPIDVIVNGEVSGIMAHENVGHPSEADRIIGREGAQAGESFYGDLLREGKLGEIKLGNEIVSIIDDPTIPGTTGFYLYDDECIKARPRYLIKNGMLNELFLNREYAMRFNTKSNAAARATTYAREPISRMANTFFEPGDYTKEELIEDVKEGILMNSFTEWNIDDRRFQSKYVGHEVFLIKNGEITDTMVRRPILELTTYGILGNIDAIAKDMFRPIGTCGKGDPLQGIPVSMGGPHMRLRDITVMGSV